MNKLFLVACSGLLGVTALQAMKEPKEMRVTGKTLSRFSVANHSGKPKFVKWGQISRTGFQTELGEKTLANFESVDIPENANIITIPDLPEGTYQVSVEEQPGAGKPTFALGVWKQGERPGYIFNHIKWRLPEGMEGATFIIRENGEVNPVTFKRV